MRQLGGDHVGTADAADTAALERARQPSAAAEGQLGDLMQTWSGARPAAADPPASQPLLLRLPVTVFGVGMGVTSQSVVLAQFMVSRALQMAWNRNKQKTRLRSAPSGRRVNRAVHPAPSQPCQSQRRWPEAARLRAGRVRCAGRAAALGLGAQGRAPGRVDRGGGVAAASVRSLRRQGRAASRRGRARVTGCPNTFIGGHEGA